MSRTGIGNVLEPDKPGYDAFDFSAGFYKFGHHVVAEDVWVLLEPGRYHPEVDLQGGGLEGGCESAVSRILQNVLDCAQTTEFLVLQALSEYLVLDPADLSDQDLAVF